MKALREKAVRF